MHILHILSDFSAPSITPSIDAIGINFKQPCLIISLWDLPSKNCFTRSKSWQNCSHLQGRNVGQMSESYRFAICFITPIHANKLFRTAAPDYQVRIVQTFPQQFSVCMCLANVQIFLRQARPTAIAVPLVGNVTSREQLHATSPMTFRCTWILRANSHDRLSISFTFSVNQSCSFIRPVNPKWCKFSS